MHYELEYLFNYFTGYDIAIIGSAAWDFDNANDIDVMVLAGSNFPALVASVGLKYHGWDRGKEHVRKTTTKLFLDYVSKPVELSQNSLHYAFYNYPYELLLRDGSKLNEGLHWDKAAYEQRKELRQYVDS